MYEKQILNKLTDKYESSKSFLGENKVQQNFVMMIKKEFPKYADDAEYEFFLSVNEAIANLISNHFVSAVKNRNGMIEKVTLQTEYMKEIYQYLNRIPRHEMNEELAAILQKHEHSNQEVLVKYVKEQQTRLGRNQTVRFFDGDMQTFEGLLDVVEQILIQQKEIYIREFSMQIFHDSKKMESIEEKVKGLLFDYGDFPERDSILEELNVIKTPTYVSIKGDGQIWLGEQKLDLGKIKGDIAFSSVSLADINKIRVNGGKVITVENLTSFHTLREQNALIIYLGGFHNSVRRKFIKLIFANNPDKEYLHFGDIDAGGFYIYEHLRMKTEVPFAVWKMDIATLEQYKGYWKKLTQNDKVRLEKLTGKEYGDVIRYMLKNDCKLEQEAVE